MSENVLGYCHCRGLVPLQTAMTFAHAQAGERHKLNRRKRHWEATDANVGQEIIGNVDAHAMVCGPIAEIPETAREREREREKERERENIRS